MPLPKTIQAVIFCLLFHITAFSNNIIIVESQSYHPMHVMDQEWLNLVNIHGDSGAIYPQSVLEEPTTLATADVLIISSSVIQLSNEKINNITTFIQNGGNVYLQSEYLGSLEGSVAFQQVATNLGVSFNWEGDVSGYVMPIFLVNSLASYSDVPVEFDYFFFAGVGSGDENVEVIAEYLGDGVGFSIQSPIAGQGKIVTYSDQDWIRQGLNIDALDYTYTFLNSTPFELPELVIDAINMANCPGDIVSFSAMVDDIPIPYTLQWFINGILLPGVTSVSFSTAPLVGDVITCEATFQKPDGSDCVVESNSIVVPPYNIPDVPTLNMVANTNDLCGSETAFFTATVDDNTDLSNFSYVWRINGQIASTTPAMSASIGNFQDGQVVTCDLIYDTPCDNGLMVTSNAILMNVTDPVAPTLAINGMATICSGELIELNTTGTNWGTNPTFEWFVDGISAGQFGPTFSSTTLTDGQIISCEVVSSIDCYTTNIATSNNIEVDITTSINPTISISASPTVCPGETMTYTVSGNDWNASAITEWFIDGVPTGNNTNTLSASNFLAGQIISCQLTNLSSCSPVSSLVSNEIVVAFSPTIFPTIEINSTPLSCLGEMITYTATGNNWDPNAQLQWYIDGAMTGNNTNTMNATNLVEGQIVYFELSNLSSCYSSSSLVSDDITVSFLPTIVSSIEITASPTVCPGENITFTATGNNWDPNGQVEWFVDGIPTAINTDEFSATNFVEGQVITCELHNLSSCYDVDPITSNELMVSFSPTIYPTIELTTITNSICENDMATISASGTNWGTNFQLTWFVDGQMFVAGNADLELPINNENQIITAEIISDLDCSDGTAVVSNPISFDFIQPAQPMVAIIIESFNCTNNNYTIVAEGNNLGTNPSYEWFVDDISVNNIGAILNAVLLPGQVVSVTVQAENECTTLSANSNILPIEFTELTTVVMEQGDALCSGGNGYAVLETTGGQGPYSYLWSDNNTQEFRTAINEGTYEVIVTDANGCIDKIDVVIGAQVGPAIQDVEVIEVNCGETYGSATVFVESESDVTISWKNEEDIVVSTESVASNLVVGKYHVEISDANGCFDVRTFEVTKMNGPIIAINDHVEITAGYSTELKPQFSTQSEMTYEWSPAIGLSCTDCESPIASPLTSITYKLTITTADDCISSTIVNVYVAESNNIYIPNIFSPNADGINDHLLVFGGQEIVNINSMMVFNRVGELMFRNNNIQPNDESKGWDGRFNGRKVQSGIYIYAIEIEFVGGRIEMYKGDVFVTE